mmetsp:Transcript_18125/g.36715  ORF Transcript_18125/g.36715 Transcript_18125/m.36715 type:complete len:105 (+) Transcript_18125:85-399(+)
MKCWHDFGICNEIIITIYHNSIDQAIHHGTEHKATRSNVIIGLSREQFLTKRAHGVLSEQKTNFRHKILRQVSLLQSPIPMFDEVTLFSQLLASHHFLQDAFLL